MTSPVLFGVEASQSDVAPLQHLLLKHPRDAFVSQDAIGA